MADEFIIQYKTELCISCPLKQDEVKKQKQKLRKKKNEELKQLLSKYKHYSSTKYCGFCNQAQRDYALDYLLKKIEQTKKELENLSIKSKTGEKFSIIKPTSQQTNNQSKQSGYKYNTEPCFNCNLMFAYSKRLGKKYRRKKAPVLIYYKHLYDSYSCHKHLPPHIKAEAQKNLQEYIEKNEKNRKRENGKCLNS